MREHVVAVQRPGERWKVEEVFAEWAEIAAEQLAAAWLDDRLAAAAVPCPTGFCHLGGRRSPTATPTGPAWPMWPTPDAQSAPAWVWRTRSTMLSRARGENGLVK